MALHELGHHGQRGGAFHESFRKLTPSIDSLWHILANQEVLQPDTLVGIGDYNKFIPRPDIHPMVWAKPGTFDQLRKPFVKTLVAFMGPSTSGKDTVLRDVVANNPDMISTVITHTNRIKRESEENGKHYYFVDTNYFETLVQSDQMVEIFPIGIDRYGTSVEALSNSLRDPSPIVIWKGEVNGWEHIKPWVRQKFPEVACISVFMLPQLSLYQLLERIRKIRGGFSWRIPKAVSEVYLGGRADVFISNPFEADAPLQAISALEKVLNKIAQK